MDALEKFLEHSAFARVGRNEIANEAILFLPVTVDAPHALLQPDGIPRNVVIDHEPAKLQVDAFARRLGRNQYLGALAEFPLGANAGARRVTVADLHAAVDLGDR